MLTICFISYDKSWKFWTNNKVLILTKNNKVLIIQFWQENFDNIVLIIKFWDDGDDNDDDMC